MFDASAVLHAEMGYSQLSKVARQSKLSYRSYPVSDEMFADFELVLEARPMLMAQYPHQDIQLRTCMRYLALSSFSLLPTVNSVPGRRDISNGVASACRRDRSED